MRDHTERVTWKCQNSLVNLFSKFLWAAASEVIFSTDDTFPAISNVAMVTQFVETPGSCRVFSVSLF